MITMLAFAFATACGSDSAESKSVTNVIADSGFENYPDLSVLPWTQNGEHLEIMTRCILVLDGDTIKTEEGDLIRLLGINAPEIAHPEHGKFEGENFGREGHKLLRTLIEGEAITLIIPTSGSRDAYGRHLAIVELSRAGASESTPLCVNLELLRSGLAHLLFMGDSTFLNQPTWLAAQEEARRERRGIWSLEPSLLPALAFDTRNAARGYNR